MRIIRNIINWWPILKDDEDWDHYYLLRVIHFKLDKMAHFHETEGHTVEADKVSSEMREAASHLKELMDDEFFNTSALDAKWGKIDLIFNDLKASFEGSAIKTDADRVQYNKDFLAEVDKEGKRRQTSLDKFCQIFKSSVFGWWD